MIFGIADDLHAPAAFADHIAFRDGLLRVISSFGVNLRPELADERSHVEFREDHDRIHIGQRCQDLRPFVIRDNWTPFPLQSANRCVGIDRHDQAATQLFGGLQIANVTHMQKIESAIRERDGLALRTPVTDKLLQFRSADKFSVNRIQ